MTGIRAHDFTTRAANYRSLFFFLFSFFRPLDHTVKFVIDYYARLVYVQSSERVAPGPQISRAENSEFPIGNAEWKLRASGGEM